MEQTKLEKARKEIDTCDEMIARMFERRFLAVREVIEYKIENHLPILDSSREENIKKKNGQRIQNDDIRPYYMQWFEELLRLSKEYQEEVKEEQ